MELDLAAKRAERSRESKYLVMRDDPDGPIVAKYELAPEVPAKALDAGSEGKLSLALRELFVDGEEAEEFIAKYQPSMEDLGTIFQGLYGLGKGWSVGERSASGS
jgi:hypothetical protein